MTSGGHNSFFSLVMHYCGFGVCVCVCVCVNFNCGKVLHDIKFTSLTVFKSTGQ